jgi:hypothetical protein
MKVPKLRADMGGDIRPGVRGLAKPETKVVEGDLPAVKR